MNKGNAALNYIIAYWRMSRETYIAIGKENNSTSDVWKSVKA